MSTNMNDNLALLQSAVENVGTNVFMSDPDLNLVYMNDKAKITLEAIKDIVYDVYKVQPEDLLGMCIDSFHKDPSYQRRILSNPKNLPHKAEIPLGPLTLDLQVAAVFDDNGDYVGTIVNWEDITAKKTAESEANRTGQMVKQAPVNILLADKDLNITYANDNSYKVLGELVKAGKISLDLDALVGMNIDGFHANPAFQRGLLKDHKTSLPRNAEIKIGGEDIDLQVDAIYDSEGEYLGAMATWSVISAQKVAEFEANKTSQMIKQAPVNILLADRDLDITYANDNSYKVLGELVKAGKLSLDLDSLVGMNIDGFHKEPSYQRGILRDHKNSLPRTAEIVIGGEDIDLQIDGVYDSEGEFLGAMATWSVITARKSAEVESAKVQSMMANMPINVMLVDQELNITYMNQTSEKTLKSIEHQLSFKVDNMMGMNIDGFHKDPSYQRNILSNHRSMLPKTAEIVIGDEDIALQVDAVYDNEGEYIGAMATWTVISAQKKMEADQAKAQERERSASVELQTKVDSLLVVAQAAGTGDLTSEITFTGEDSMGQLADGFGQMIDNISDVLRDVGSGSNQIDGGTQQIASASQSLSEGAAQQAANLEQISASLEQMSSMTNQNADNAGQAAQLSEESQTSAGKGQSEMGQMSEAMDQIKKSSSEISKIIKVIDEIAFQTNLLALNAAVEAARAGEAGKGFAVVAEEVRNLAQRSAEAAKNTSAMIEESTQRADNGVSIANRVGEALEEIVASTAKVNTLLGEIASASKEQADGISEVNKGVSEMDRVTQQNAGNAEELASASEETAAQVSNLRDLIAQFTISDDGSGGSTGSNASPKKPKASKPKRVNKHAIPLDAEDDFESF